MNDIFLILLAGGIVAAVGYPLVTAFAKWKKAMDDAEAEENGEGGEDDVQDR